MADQKIFEVPEMVGQETDFYDEHDPSQPTLYALKVVDITALTHNTSQRTLLIYTKAQRGRLVILRIYYPNENFGSDSSWFFDEKTSKSQQIWRFFSRTTDINATQLLRLIQEQAPK